MKRSPHKVKTMFPSQREGEKVIMMLRRHWVIIWRYLSMLILFNIIPVLVFAFLFLFLGWTVVPGTPLYLMLVFGISLYYLMIWLHYFHEFVDFHLDIWIVTDQRIINIEQIGLFNRVISELNILKVQDVTSELKGKVQTMLNYGNVYIQTAGTTQRFQFEQVKDPEEIARIIIRVHDNAIAKTTPEEIQRVQQEKELLKHQPIDSSLKDYARQSKKGKKL